MPDGRPYNAGGESSSDGDEQLDAELRKARRDLQRVRASHGRRSRGGVEVEPGGDNLIEGPGSDSGGRFDEEDHSEDGEDEQDEEQEEDDDDDDDDNEEEEDERSVVLPPIVS